MSDTELCYTGARKLAHMIGARKVSAAEVIGAYVGRIERINPQVNAIVTFLPERALAEAKKLDRLLARRSSASPGPLAGLPIAFKDIVPTKGIRTTFGSPIYADHVPAQDHALVERLSAAGAITIGKTNTPEFAVGSQTFNPVFGATLNPYDLSKTCGGSSGGAAVSVATAMLPFADGSDLGASLRNPGSFCNVVGFRPTPGRVPLWPFPNAWDTLWSIGPIARTAEDAAFLFSAMAGPDARSPTTQAEPGSIFARPLARSFRKVRIAWSRDLGGLPVDTRVTRVLEAQRGVFKALGCVVEDAEPDIAAADEAFQVQRALGFVEGFGELLKTERARMKDTFVWNIEQGLQLDAARIARASVLRSQVYHAMRSFLERYEFLLLPACQVPPFPVTQPYVTEINGVKLASYFDWMKTCYMITATSHPAISVPAGFTDEGLPVGLQIVGRYRDDFGVLQLAHAFEAATQVWKRRPPLAA
ncbi:MAG: amidase [Betaproteobacteria bacterium]|nr:amidase [Betaproteobacteria bacterium]